MTNRDRIVLTPIRRDAIEPTQLVHAVLALLEDAQRDLADARDRQEHDAPGDEESP